MPVKILSVYASGVEHLLEDQINRWMEEHVDVVVHHVSLSSVPLASRDIKLYACIYYQRVTELITGTLVSEISETVAAVEATTV